MQKNGSIEFFVYCNNNPIMYTDPDGEFIITASMVVSWIISTGIFAINGGISAHLMGQSFWRGFAAGAVAGLFGGIIGSIGGAGFILLGRIVGTAGYGLLNEFLQYGTLANMNWDLYAVDILMDFGLGLFYAGPMAPTDNKLMQAFLQGMIEMGIDTIQTYLYYSPKAQAFYYTPEAQARIRGYYPTAAEGYTSGRRYEDKSRFYMNKLCVST